MRMGTSRSRRCSSSEATRSAVGAFSSSWSCWPPASKCRSTARDAASASGCRTKVPAKNVTPISGNESSPYCHAPPSSASRNRASPATMPMGMPPPGILPYVAMSAFTPNQPCAPRGWQRSPVIISSKINAAPASAVMPRSAWRNSRGWRLGLRLWTGSTSTAANSPACTRRKSSASWLPYSRTVTFSSMLAGMPGATGVGLSGPGRTRTSSKMP